VLFHECAAENQDRRARREVGEAADCESTVRALLIRIQFLFLMHTDVRDIMLEFLDLELGYNGLFGPDIGR
jgi:hypothetical protein